MPFLNPNRHPVIAHSKHLPIIFWVSDKYYFIIKMPYYMLSLDKYNNLLHSPTGFEPLNNLIQS